MLPKDGPPKGICQILAVLKEHGFEAFLVGGAVRDAFLYGSWQAVADWDLATSARPEDVEKLFPKTIPIGKAHGTIQVNFAGAVAEVTTFRQDGDYSDHRRPDLVFFTTNVEEDLARRDFTIGAMAYDPLAKQFNDPYGGQRDLKRRLIRAVGDPTLRISEDYLRMLRAVRFASTLGFSLEPSLGAAIAALAPGAGELAPERVFQELAKILLGREPSVGIELLKRLGILEALGLEAGGDLAWLDRTPPILSPRLAVLWGELEEEELRETLRKLRTPRQLQREVLLLHSLAYKDLQSYSDYQLRLLLAQVGPEYAENLIAIWRTRQRGIDGPKERLERFGALSRQELPLKVEDLAIDGEAIMRLLGIRPGPQVGIILNKLLSRVLLEPELNYKERLEELVKGAGEMADVRPMRALRYNLEKVTAESVVAPPYDVISKEEQEALYEASPYNIIRLELGKEEAGDHEDNNRYTRAAAQLAAWREEEVLKLDQEPSFYLYEQEFTVEGKTHQRRGIFGRLKLMDFSEGIVLPHEETLSGPKADRTQLLDATRTNLSPIFGLFPDEERELGSIFDKLAAAEPDVDFQGFDQIQERLWRIADPAIIERISSLFQQEKIYIADGHHRYETALAYSKKHPEFDAILIVLVPMNSPGLVCLPTHRMVFDVELEGLLSRLESKFAVESFAPSQKAKTELLAKLETEKHAFGLVLPDGYHFLQLKAEAKLVPEEIGHSPAYAELDVTILHQLILEAELGIGPEELRAEAKVRYTRSSDEAFAQVESGQMQAAFLMGPLEAGSVRDVAEEGEKMPQKSTYFYPKLITGLVLNPLEEQNS